MIETAVDYNVI